VTRGLRDDNRRPARGGDVPFSIDDEASSGRSRTGIHEDGAPARVGRLRDDPGGRRSLTGLEFRRQRST